MPINQYLPSSVLQPGIMIFSTCTANADLSDFLADDYNFELCMRKLSLRDQLKVRNSRHNRNRELVVRLFTKAVLNYVMWLQRKTKFDPWRELHFDYNEYGKPRLRGQTDLAFEYNSSGSNDIVSIIVQVNCPSPVGIDLSHERQDLISANDFMDQFNGIFAQQELDQLVQIDDTRQRYVCFNHFWTLKEAFTKFVGCGLNVDLSSFWFRLPRSKLTFRNAFTPEGEHMVTRYDIDWLSGIEVDFADLPEPFVSGIGTRKVYCCSGVLRHGADLPVIISCISQEEGLVEKSTNFHIDMRMLLEAELGEN